MFGRSCISGKTSGVQFVNDTHKARTHLVRHHKSIKQSRMGVQHCSLHDACAHNEYVVCIMIPRSFFCYGAVMNPAFKHIK